MKPLITRQYSIDTESNRFRVYEHKAVGLLKLVDRLYPRLVGGSDKRGGTFFTIFDEHGLVGSATGRPAPNGFTAGSIMKSPFYKGPARIYETGLIIQHLGGNLDNMPAECKLHNYGSLRFWQNLGLACKPMAGGDRWKTAFADETSIPVMREAQAKAKDQFIDDVHYAEAVLKNLLGSSSAASYLPDEDTLGTPVITCDIVLGAMPW